MINLKFNGNEYSTLLDLSRALPPMTSVLVAHLEDAEFLCASAAGLCYDTSIERGQPSIARILRRCRDAGHGSVLEHGTASFVKKVPIFVARQDLRARHATFSERSLRYCRADNGDLTYYIPDYLSEEAIQVVEDATSRRSLQTAREQWVDLHEQAVRLYSRLTDGDLPAAGGALLKETARAILPVGINTVYLDTRNLSSWLHHSAKRLCLRAQKEIRLIREQEVAQLAAVYPVIFGDVKRSCLTKQGCTEKRKQICNQLDF